MNYDEYQWPGLSLTQSNGLININLKDTALVDFQRYYESSYCNVDFSNPNSNTGVYGVFSAIISITVLDVDGQVLKQFSIPYIKGKFEYSVVYTSNIPEKINVIANAQVTNGKCGQWMRYYAARYINSNPSTTSTVPVTFNTVLRTTPTIGLSYTPWRYRITDTQSGGNFIGGADTFYHTLKELPYNYYDVRGTDPKIVFDWPNSVTYRLFVDVKDSSGNWVNIYNEETISESTFNNFANVVTFEHNTVMELLPDDGVSWTGQYAENFYKDGKGQFIALRAIDPDTFRKLLNKVGSYRVYGNTYEANILVGTSNVYLIDATTNVVEEPEPPVDPPVDPEPPVEPPVVPPIEEDEVPIPTTYKFNESAYFKHTNGEAFTLNGVPYYGFFHILSGDAFVGRTHLESQAKLDRKDTLIADIFLRSYHFDTCFGNFQNISESAQIDTFELLNLQGLNNLIDQINDNNIKCYRNLIIQNPTVYNFLDNNNHFYGLSALEQETRYKWDSTYTKWKDFDFSFGNASLLEPIESGLPSKNTYSYIQPFSKNRNWAFLANIKMGSFVLDQYDNFKYFCSDGRTTYILDGNFSTSDPLKFVSSEEHSDSIASIYNDDTNNRIFLVKQDSIDIYDSSAFINCNNLILVDKLSPNTSNLNTIKFGKNIRSALSGSELGLYNKYSNQKYYDFDLSQFGIKNVLDLDIRDVDDNIIILYRLNTGFYVCFFDPNNIQNTFFNKKIEELTDQTSKIEFSKIDSNIFHTYNQKEYQTRSLTFPVYPNGRLEKENLLYYNFEYKWGDTKQAYNFMDIVWNTKNSDSNVYNNQTNSSLVRNNYMYMLLHNNGRIYSIKQPVNDRYLTAAPLNLEKTFVETQCSQSSFGLYLNSMITNIIKDLLNIYNKTSNTFRFDKSQVFYDKLKDLVISSEDLYLNGNETVNVLVLRRILTSIIDIQKKLLPDA